MPTGRAGPCLIPLLMPVPPVETAGARACRLFFAGRRKPRVNAVIVHKIDRLARDIYDYSFIKAYLKRHGVRLVSVAEPLDESPVGHLLEHIMAAMAEFYSANLSEETKKGMRMAFEEGGWPECAPRGYLNVRDDRGRAAIVVDPIPAAAIRRAFELYGTGEYTFYDLDEQLQREGHSNRPPVKHLRRYLSNPFYVGRVRMHGQTRVGRHAPLISTELFERVQSALAERRRSYGRRFRHDFLLRGLVWCSCGSRMTTEQHKGRRYYRCTNRTRTACRLRYARADVVERAVLEMFKAMGLPRSTAPASVLERISLKRTEIIKVQLRSDPANPAAACTTDLSLVH